MKLFVIALIGAAAGAALGLESERRMARKLQGRRREARYRRESSRKKRLLSLVSPARSGLARDRADAQRTPHE